MALPTPPKNLTAPIPNNPFYSPSTWEVDSGQGQFVVGTGLTVDALTGNLTSAPYTNPAGTVTAVTAGPGLVTSPVGGITVAGSISLALVPGLVGGTYTNPAIQVDTRGRIVSISSGATPVQSVSGSNPIFITGPVAAPVVNILAGNTTRSGAVQLRDDCNTPSTTLALTANQGYVLQTQINAIATTVGGQFLAGTLNANTGLVATATTAGITVGIVSGSTLPFASAGNAGAYLVVTTAGTYTPPGGISQAYVVGDELLSDGTAWVPILKGFRAPYATTTSSGVVELATPAEVNALTDNSLAVTPGSMATLLASAVQLGLVQLATNAETQTGVDSTKAVTPAGLNSLQATTTTRGLVSLNDTVTSTSVTEAATANAVKQVYDAALLKSLFLAVGDLLVGGGAGVANRLPIGTNGSYLTADNTQPSGVAWTVPGAPYSVPTGTVIWFTNSGVVPNGYLVCDGSAVDRTTYANLFSVLGITFGPGDGSTTFNLPDLRGQFIRGYNDAGGTPGSLDPGRPFGSSQTDAYEQHSHGITDPTHNHGVTDPGHNHGVTDPGHNHSSGGFADVQSTALIGASLMAGDGSTRNGNPATTGITINGNATGVTINGNATGITVNNSPAIAATPDETRPTNVALLPIIKI
jgi:microcystin-dependent protein